LLPHAFLLSADRLLQGSTLQRALKPHA